MSQKQATQFRSINPQTISDQPRLILANRKRPHNNNSLVRDPALETVDNFDTLWFNTESGRWTIVEHCLDEGPTLWPSCRRSFAKHFDIDFCTLIQSKWVTGGEMHFRKSVSNAVAEVV
jgi:hypothetical protein